MTQSGKISVERLDSGLHAVCGLAAFYRIAADPLHLQRDLALGERDAAAADLVRAAKAIGLKARIVAVKDVERLAALPAPFIVRLRSGGFAVYVGRNGEGLHRFVDPVTRLPQDVPASEAAERLGGEAVLITRRFNGAGVDPASFGLLWFLPSIWRYRRPIADVMLASLFIQIFALVTPLFFRW